MSNAIDYRGWTIHLGPPVQIQPPGRDPLPGGYRDLRGAKKAISMAQSHAKRAANPTPPEVEHVMEYRGWIIHIARNPRRVTRPDWIRIQAPGETIQPTRYRKLQHAKQAIIEAQHNAQKTACSSPHGTIASAEAEEPLG